MPNLLETSDNLRRRLQARVPLIVVRSIERTRALGAVTDTARAMKAMAFYTHSRTTGLFELGGRSPVNDDRSLVGAFDYAARAFQSRDHVNFIFSDIEDLDTESTTARHLAELVLLAEARQGSVIVVSSSPVWSGLGRLGMTVTLDLPDNEELRDTISGLVEGNRANGVPIDWYDDDIRRAAEILAGLTNAEALNAVATLMAKGSLTTDDVRQLSEFKDQIFGDLSGIEKVNLREEDYAVGGLVSLRQWLARKRELISSDLSGTALHPPRGVLLAGVPGCGKSLSAKAIAAEWGLPLYRLDMGAVLGMYVGQSEGRLREALEAADQVSPCVLWIDEIEKGFASGGGDSGTTRRLIGQFLYWLQESREKVFLVATANEVSSLPPELLRKGRFDEIFFVDLPDDEDRAEIVRMYFTKYTNTDISPYLVDELVELTDGFSGADIESAIHDIGTEMHTKHLDALPSEDLIKDVIRNVLPFSRTNPDELAEIRAWGRERAVPAGRQIGDGDAKQAAGGRRIVLTD
jgi:hypothetical protein